MGDRKRTVTSTKGRVKRLRSAIIADGIALGLSYHDKDLIILSNRVDCEGPAFVEVTLPLLGKALDAGLVNGIFICPTNFARMGKTSLPALFYRAFSAIFEDGGELRRLPNTDAIRHLRQLLLFDSKLIKQPSAEEEEAAVRDFLGELASLDTREYQKITRYSKELKSSLDWFSDLLTSLISDQDMVLERLRRGLILKSVGSSPLGLAASSDTIHT